MPRLLFHHLDVFTAQPMGGNPLAVFPEPEELGTEQMQALARELNLSETVFITAREPDRLRYYARIFTPQRELTFAGHPVLGAAWQLLRDTHPATEQITLVLKAGEVPVWIDRGLEPAQLYFSPPPVNLETTLLDLDLIARLCNIKTQELAVEASPVQLASIGPRFLLIPLRHRGVLERVEIDIHALRDLAIHYDCDMPVVFCREGYAEGSQYAMRVFSPNHGVPEDPASGSAAGCLAAYMRYHGLIHDCGQRWLRLDQGYSLRRPSTVWFRANLDLATQRVSVQVGGQVVPLAWGTVEL